MASHDLQEAEKATRAAAQASAGQVTAAASIQDVQSITTAGVTDTGAMDVDEDAATQGPGDDGRGGIKRKAGEETEPAAKKPRMGMFMTLFGESTGDTVITCRTRHRSFEEVNLADLPLIIQLLNCHHRDRENCTAFVSDLPESAAEDDLKALFKDVRFIPTLLKNKIDHERVYFSVR